MFARVRPSKVLATVLVIVGATLLVVSSFATVASAGTGPGLGTADPFAVLAGAGVTNTGPTVIGGNLGTCPTASISGFPPGTVGGTIHANDAVACGAQADTTNAYNVAAGRAPTQPPFGGPTDLGGLTLTDGVYKTPTSFAITGTLTLNGQGNPDATFIFQAGSTLITATDSAVELVNGAQACNVFWQVGSSATLGVRTLFKGTMLVLTSITANTNARVEGRLLARNGAVTLDSNVINRATCATTPTTAGPTPTTGGGTPTTSGGTPTTASPTPTTGGATPTTAGPTPTTAGGTPTTAGPTPTTAGSSPTTAGTPATTVPPTGTTAVPGPSATTTTVGSGPFVTTGAGGPTSGAGNAQAVDRGVTVTPGGPATTRSQTGTVTRLPRTGGMPPWSALAGIAAITCGLALHQLARRPLRRLV